MKTAILSDIHSNPVALEKCLADAKEKGCQKFLCLGDIVGYGYAPNTCIDICRKENIPCLMGNHEAGLLGKLPLQWFSEVAKKNIYRQQEIVTADNKTWLDSLKYSTLIKTEKGFIAAFAHGTYTYPSRFDYINGYSDAALEFPDLKVKGIHALFVGHTHVAEAYVYEKNYNISETFIDTEDETPIKLADSPCTIVNVGSCGYPRSQPYSIYCIFDDEEETVTHQILEFDFEDYCKKMAAANIEIPLWVKSRKKEAEDRRIGWR